MIHYAIVFFILAIVAAALGLSGVAYWGVYAAGALLLVVLLLLAAGPYTPGGPPTTPTI